MVGKKENSSVSSVKVFEFILFSY